MPNYFLSVDTSNFKPLSYEERATPFHNYEKNYLDTREEIQRYIDEYGNLTLPEGSRDAEQIAEFNEQAQRAFNNFAISGLNKNTSRELNKIFTGYSLVKKRKEDLMNYNAAIQEANKNHDKSIIDNFTFDDFIDGKIPNIQSVDRESLTKNATLVGAALNNQGQSPSIVSIGSGLLNIVQNPVFSTEDIDSAIQNLLQQADSTVIGTDGMPTSLSNSILQLLQSAGYDRFKSLDAKREILHTIGVGLIQSSSAQSQIMQNPTLKSVGSSGGGSKSGDVNTLKTPGTAKKGQEVKIKNKEGKYIVGEYLNNGKVRDDAGNVYDVGEDGESGTLTRPIIGDPTTEDMGNTNKQLNIVNSFGSGKSNNATERISLENGIEIEAGKSTTRTVTCKLNQAGVKVKITVPISAPNKIKITGYTIDYAYNESKPSDEETPTVNLKVKSCTPIYTIEYKLTQEEKNEILAKRKEEAERKAAAAAAQAEEEERKKAAAKAAAAEQSTQNNNQSKSASNNPQDSTSTLGSSGQTGQGTFEFKSTSPTQ